MLFPALIFHGSTMASSSFAPAVIGSLLVMATGMASLSAGIWFLLPKNGYAAEGVRIEGKEIPPNTTAEQYIRELAQQKMARTVALQIPNASDSPCSLEQLGVRPDIQTTMRRVMQVGRQGSLAYRIAESWRARRAEINVPLSFHVDADPLLQQVIEAKQKWDYPSTPARYDFHTQSALPHKNGKALDSYGVLDRLYDSLRSEQDAIDLPVPVAEVPPVVTANYLDHLDMSQRVGHFETRFATAGGQANRAHNIATAAARLDGIVMLPGQVISFNQLVGHRTMDNGFQKAWEIFKGEMVEGVGGGTCQVASTLHAAAYLGGLDIVERSPHSRPSGYIDIGLDATVVDGLVDLKLRNPFLFPVVLHSVVNQGQITFEILGEQRPVRVTFRGEVISTQRYKRKVQEASWLTEGRVLRKQRGIRGFTVRKVRLIRARDGQQREEVTRDFYPPTTEIFLVPPGTDPEKDLPPLPQEGGKAQDDTDRDSSERPKLEIENAPSARAPAPTPSHHVFIDR